VHQYDLDPIQGQDQGHGASEFPKIALFYTYLLCHFRLELKTDDWCFGDDNMGPGVQLV